MKQGAKQRVDLNSIVTELYSPLLVPKKGELSKEGVSLRTERMAVGRAQAAAGMGI